MKITRLYIHNFSCFSNFEFSFGGSSPTLVIGKNGTGKTSFLDALLVFQGIARAWTNVQQAFGVPPMFGGASGDIRLEIDLEAYGQNYSYRFAVGVADDRKAFRVKEEGLLVSGAEVFSRRDSSVTSHTAQNGAPSTFNLDVNLFALPVIQALSPIDPIAVVRGVLGNMFILQPIPQLMKSEANEVSAVMVKTGETFASWLLYMLASWPAAYAVMDRYLKTVFPDFKSLVTLGNPIVGKHYFVQFEKNASVLQMLISKLSNGEKCQLMAAAMMGVNSVGEGIICAWDEPTNYLALNEVGPMMSAMRASFKKNGQLIVTAHSDEAILQFTDDTTYVFSRKSHLDPILPPVTLAQLRQRNVLTGDLATALRLGDVDNEC